MDASSLETLEAAALQLPRAERAHLAERLLVSLENEDEVLAAWVEEAERRLDALEAGRTRGIPLEEALPGLRAGLLP